MRSPPTHTGRRARQCPHPSLLRCGISHRSHRHVRGRQSTDLSQLTGYPKVRQQDPSLTILRLCKENVAGFYVAMQRAPLVCVVERTTTAVTMAHTSRSGIPFGC
jgi:hypothetical protein